MTELSPDACAKARNIRGHLLRLIHEKGQCNVADALGIDDSTISRWLIKPDGLERACELLAVLGLRLKPISEPEISSVEFEAMRVLARATLDKREAAR